MNDAVSDDDDDDAGEADGKAKHPAVVLAKAVWRDQLKERGIDSKDKAAATGDWKEKKKQYVSLSKRILRQLDRKGYALSPKAAE